MKLSPRAASLLVAALALVPASLHAQTGDGIPKIMRGKIETSDYKANGRLVLVNGQARTTFRFKVKAHWFPDGLQALYQFTSADGVTEDLLLHVNGQGHGTVRKPAQTGVAAHAGGLQLNGLFGTAVSYEDLVENQFFWANQETGAPAAVAGHACTNVKSTPTPVESSRYASVTSCVDAARAIPLHVSKTLRSSRKQEDFSYSGIRRSGEVWIATQVELKVAGESGSTLLLIDGGSTKAKLAHADFDLWHAGGDKEP